MKTKINQHQLPKKFQSNNRKLLSNHYHCLLKPIWNDEQHVEQPLDSFEIIKTSKILHLSKYLLKLVMQHDIRLD